MTNVIDWRALAACHTADHGHTRAECGTCGAIWCDDCDPTPAALCHYCHGRGYSTHEITGPVWVRVDCDRCAHSVTVPADEWADIADIIGEDSGASSGMLRCTAWPAHWRAAAVKS